MITGLIAQLLLDTGATHTFLLPVHSPHINNPHESKTRTQTADDTYMKAAIEGEASFLSLQNENTKNNSITGAHFSTPAMTAPTLSQDLLGPWDLIMKQGYKMEPTRIRMCTVLVAVAVQPEKKNLSEFRMPDKILPTLKQK